MTPADREAVKRLLAAAPPVPMVNAEAINTALGQHVRTAYERLAASPDRLPAA